MSLEPFYRSCGIPKGVPRRIVKARKLRMAKAVIGTVRPQVVERDGHCRLSQAFGDCDGPSEWAHTDRGAEGLLRATRAGRTVLV